MDIKHHWEWVHLKHCMAKDGLVNRIVLGPEMLKEVEQEFAKIRKNLKASQDKHKSYAYLKRVHKEFKIGDHVYLRLKPRKRSLKLGSCAKMEPRYCGQFKVLDRIGIVACRIGIPTNMKVNNVFHVSLLKDYVHDLNHVIQVKPKGEFQVEIMCILYKKVTLL